MAYRLPTRAYFIPLAGPVLWMIEQYASLTDWWPKIPFGWMAILSVAFGAGLVIQDIANPGSWVRHNWRELRRTFKILSAHCSYQNGENERVELICVLKFTKAASNPLLTVKVTDINRTSVVIKERLGDIAKDDERHLRLGSIRLHKAGWTPRHSVWGEELGSKDIAPDQKAIVPESRNIVEIAVNGRKEYLMIQMIPQSDTFTHAYILTRDAVRELLSPLNIG